MIRDDMIRMAREAGASRYTSRHFPDRPTHTFTVDQLQRFIELVADAEAKRIHDEGMVTVGHMREQIAAERKRLAFECIDLVAAYGGPVDLEAAIRARGQA